MPKLFKIILSLSLMLAILAQPTYAAEKSVKIKVTVVKIELVENNHVGNEWYTAASVKRQGSVGGLVRHADAQALRRDPAGGLRPGAG